MGTAQGDSPQRGAPTSGTGWYAGENSEGCKACSFQNTQIWWLYRAELCIGNLAGALCLRFSLCPPHQRQTCTDYLPQWSFWTGTLPQRPAAAHGDSGTYGGCLCGLWSVWLGWIRLAGRCGSAPYRWRAHHSGHERIADTGWYAGKP